MVRPFEWDAFCKAIGRPDLSDDPRYKTNADRESHTTALNAILRPLLLTRPTAAWSGKYFWVAAGALIGLNRAQDDTQARVIIGVPIG